MPAKAQMRGAASVVHAEEIDGARAGAPRTLNRPRPAQVRVGGGGQGGEGEPLTIAGEHVEIVRETWLVEDRWWTDEPLRRRYWELVTAKGRNVVVFHDLLSGRWFRQAG